MKYILIIGEKPDMGTNYAASLGGVKLSNGQELTMENIKKYDKTVKSDRFKNGRFEGIIKEGSLKGKRAIYSWCFGHIATLFDAKDYDPSLKRWDLNRFPFIPEKFERKINEGLKPHFGKLKQLMNSSDCECIINGTDADREGEAIFDDIYVLSNCKKPVKRLWLNEVNDKAIVKAFDNLKNYEEMFPLRDSARARMISDWAVGINLTVLSSVLFSNDGKVVSVGRVQTPTLNILVKREKEIQNFKPENYYEIHGDFSKNGDYKGILQYGKDNRIKNEAEAKSIALKLNSKNAEIKNLIREELKEQPPMFYDLGSIQGDANVKFGFTLKHTLDIVQKLYEAGYVTYPRTENKYIPDSEAGSLRKRISLIPDEYRNFRDLILSKSKIALGNRYIKNTSDAHFAIILAGKADMNKLSEDERKIYDLVAKSMICPFLGEAVWENTKVTTSVNGNDFLSTGKILRKKGWRELIPKEKEDDILPVISKGDTVSVKRINILKKSTKAPNRYTDKTLQDTMEKISKIVGNNELKQMLIKSKGIGTAATRADIIEKLIKVEYIKRTGKTLEPTLKGIWLIDKLPIEEIKSPEMTAEWEERLSNIADKKDSFNSFTSDIKEFVLLNSNKLKNTKIEGLASQNVNSKSFSGAQQKEEIGKCILCGSPMYESDKSFYCSGYKKGCKGSIWKNDKEGNSILYGGKKLTKAMVKTLLSKKQTTELTFKTKDGKEYKDRLYIVAENGYINIRIGWQLKKKNKN